MGDIVSTDKKIQADLYKIYMESKSLFVDAEERFPDMRFFSAPTLEHRDALEHIMRYFNLARGESLSETAVKELEAARGHEIRAFFDTADYICISVRKEINKALKSMSRRKIESVWEDYWNIKGRIFSISSEIAEIRKQRKGDMESVEKYLPILKELWKIYDDFELKILKKIYKK